jgi:hypothetical protein
VSLVLHREAPFAEGGADTELGSPMQSVSCASEGYQEEAHRRSFGKFR